MALVVGMTYDLRTDYIAEGMSEEDAAEFDSPETIGALEAAIGQMGFRIDRIGNAKALVKRLVRGDRWDLVFNIAEGVKGRSREAQVPAILELYDVPYTMSDPLVCAATLDKAVAKRLVASAGLPTAPFAVVAREEDCARVALEYPLFAKPLAEGTGKGITERSRIDSSADLTIVCRRLLGDFDQPVLVEEFLPGREFTVGIVGNGRKARSVGTLEVVLKDAEGGGIYSYESKERCEVLVEYRLAPEEPLTKEVERLALDCHRALECRDVSRVDIRLDRRGRPSFLEVNPLPGLHPKHSDLPIAAGLKGITYERLIASVVESALERLGIRYA